MTSVLVFIIIECYRKLDPETYTDIYETFISKDITKIFLSKDISANLSKFNSVSMLGGVTMNGETIYSLLWRNGKLRTDPIAITSYHQNI